MTDETLTIKLPGKLLVCIDAWAAANELGRSQAIRKLLEQSLADEPLKSGRRKVEPWIERAVRNAEERSRRDESARQVARKLTAAECFVVEKFLTPTSRTTTHTNAAEGGFL